MTEIMFSASKLSFFLPNFEMVNYFKQHISIALTVIFMMGMVWQFTTIIHFYLNREAIAEKHCVNKNNPEKTNCKGQCHLKKQLEAATPEQEEQQKSPAPSGKASVLLLVFAETQKTQQIEFTPMNERSVYSFDTGKTNGFSPEIFTPPRWV